MATTSPTITSVINELRQQNSSLPTEKKQNIIVVQEQTQAKETTNIEMLRVLNSIFNLLSDQLRFQKSEAAKAQMRDLEKPTDFQEAPMEVAPHPAGGGGVGGGEGGGGGGAQETIPTATPTAAKEGGSLLGQIAEGVGGVAKKAWGMMKEHPVATAAAGGAAIGAAIDYGSKPGKFKFDPEIEKIIKETSKEKGIDENYMRTMAYIESKGDPRAQHGEYGKGAAGLYQFVPSTAKEYGIRGKEYDPRASANAAAEYSLKNKIGLEKAGIEATPEMMYLAHQQGLGGAKKLINYANQGKSFSELDKELRRNIISNTPKHEPMSAQEFLDHWKKTYRDKAAIAGIKNTSNTDTNAATKANSENLKTGMVDVSELRVKGGLKGQAFKGGNTEEGTLNLARSIQADEENLPGGLKRFSSFNDEYHRKSNPKSKHTQGLAFDLSLKDAKKSSEAESYIKDKLLASGMSEEDFKIINEYKKPSKHSTGGHIHVNFANKEAAEKYAAISSGENAPQSDKMAAILEKIEKNTGESKDIQKETSKKEKTKGEDTKKEEPSKEGETATKEQEAAKEETATKESQEQPKTFAEAMESLFANEGNIEDLLGQYQKMASGETAVKESQAAKPEAAMNFMTSNSQQNPVSQPNSSMNFMTSNSQQNPVSQLGVSPFGGSFGGDGSYNTQGNPFYKMQDTIGKMQSVESIGRGIGSSMKQGGLYGIQGALGGAQGIMNSMGMGQSGLGRMMGDVGQMIGNVRGMQNMTQGMGGGIMGGISTASGVLGSLGNIFNSTNGMGGMLGGLSGGIQGILNPANMAAGAINSASKNPTGMVSGVMGAAGGLYDSVKNIGSSIADTAGSFFGTSSDKGIGSDAASINAKYSTETPTKTGENLGGLQSVNDKLSSSGVTPFSGPSVSGSGGGGTQQPQSASGPAGAPSGGGASGNNFKSGQQRAGTSSGAMGVQTGLRNEESCLQTAQRGCIRVV